MENLQYPIGKYQKPDTITREHIEAWIEEITALPEKIKAITSRLSTQELHYIYRPEGWNIKQVIHHLADSHMNCLMRFKLALTEDLPTIRPYEQQLWSELADGVDDNIKPSLALLESLHYKWVVLLKSLNEQQLKKQFFHPAAQKVWELDATIGMYAWHGNHHLEHIKQALAHQGNF
jgi:hypothetical protein